MRLKAKMIGDEMDLDEYNAYQYLLYHMNCWKEDIYLNMSTPHKGDYATYTLTEYDWLLNDRKDSYKVAENLTSDKKLVINLSDTTELLDREHMEFKCKLYYDTSQAVDEGTVYPDDSPEYEPTENKSILKFEAKKEFKNIVLPCTLNGNTLEIPLFNNGGAILKKSDLLYRWIELQIDMSKTPWIDLKNGKVNEPYEILINSEEQLRHVIEYAPHDGTLTTVRLDSSKIYYIPETLEISKGQNIEIRGGTCEYIGGNSIKNGLTVLDGTFCKRTFIVKPGAELKLEHIQLQKNNSYGHGIYDMGRGGAILVEAVRRDDGVNKYGILRCNDCTFVNNKAAFGGAIFSYHAGCFLEHCIFINNNSSENGGSVYYWAHNVRLHFANMLVENGSVITLNVKVTDYLARPVGEGEINFYIKDGTKWKILETVNVTESWTRRGWASYQYKIPKDNAKTKLNFLAEYLTGAKFETEIAMNTVNIIVPQVYTASFTTKLLGIPLEKLTINAKVLSPDGTNIRKPKGKFVINGTTYDAKHDGNAYYIKYEIPKDIKEDEIPISFEIEDSIYYNCKKITSKIQIGSEKKSEIKSSPTGLFVPDGVIKPTAPNSKEYYDSTITDDLVKAWLGAGITDIFTYCTNYENAQWRATLTTILKKVEGKNIRVHAVISTFRDFTQSEEKDQWGKANPSTLARRNAIIKQIGLLLKNTAIDGICFDSFRFNGSNSKEYNGSVEAKNRKTHVTEAAKLFVDEVNKTNDKIYTSVCLMPENCDEYGQDYTALNGIFDYLMPMVYKGNYKEESNDSDSWVKDKIESMMINTLKCDKNKIWPIIQTYTNDKDLDEKIKAKNHGAAIRSKTNLENTMKVISQTGAMGVSLFREGYVNYPSPYEKFRK